MTDARHRSFWHRAGPLIAVTALLGGAAAEGCGGGGETTTGTGGSGPGGTSTSSATGTGGTGGTGGGALAMDNGIDAPSPLDATPDPDGKIVYFTAIGPNGPGVFSAPPGSSSATEIKAGAPFVSPFGIAIGFDGKQLYVADPGADAGNDRGELFVLPVAGGTPAALAGSEDTVPRGVEIAQEGEKDVLFFTGNDKGDGQPGVFKIPATGGAITVVAKGAPFHDPGGIAIASNGDVYVTDTVSAASHSADVIVVSGGAATVLVSGLSVGYPAGIALSLDEKTVYVSGYDPATRTDRLIAVDLPTKGVSLLFEKEIGSFVEAAGLHRAKNVEAYSWADSTAGPMGGKVFVVK